MKTRRTFIAVLAAVLVTILAVVVFAACNKGGHKHTYSQQWSHDDEYHWHQADCGHDLQRDKAKHSLDANGNCPVCGYSQQAKETKGLVFEPDASGDGWAVSCQGNPGATVEIPAYYQDKPVTTVKAEAFDGSTGIKNLTIPHTVKEIGERAFLSCGIETVTFGESIELESVGSYAFNGDPITKVYYGGTLASWCKIQFGDGGEDHNGDADANPMAPYFGDDERERHFYLVNNGVAEELTEIVIPQEVTKLLDYTFYGFTEVTSVTVHNGVTKIGNTFSSLNKLETLTVPFVGTRDGELDTNFWAMFQETSSMAPLDIVVTNATTLPHTAFSNVPVKNLTLPATLRYIGWGVVSGCKNLSNVYFNGTLEDWCNIEFDSNSSNPMSGRNFYYLADGQQTEISSNLVIPDSVEHVPSFAFLGANGLKSVTIPASVTSIGDKAFYNCMTIESLNIYGSPTVGQEAFYRCPNISTVTLASAENIIMGAFLENWEGEVGYSFETVVILGGTSIGANAFDTCANLKNVTLPDGLESIGYGAFMGCRDLAEIDLPNTLTEIDGWAFQDCVRLKEITIPENVTQMGESVFLGCDIATVYCELAEKPEYSNEEGWLYRWSGNAKVVWNCRENDVAEDGNIYVFEDGLRFKLCNGEATVLFNMYEGDGDIVIPDVISHSGTDYTVTAIIESAFREENRTTDTFDLISLVIPSTVKTIGYEAFFGCDNLQSMTFEEGIKLQSIGYRAFDSRYRYKFENVNYGGSLADWCAIEFGTAASNPMYSAKHFNMKQGDEWQEVTEIVIPEGVRTISEYAFV